jgi:hypothetical protein
VAARGGPEARPPQARPRARPVHLPSRVAGGSLPPSARHGHLARPRGVVAGGAARGRLLGGSHAVPGPQGAVGDVGPLGQLPGQHVRARRLRPRVGPEADELPRGDPHLQDEGALLSRAADSLRGLLGPVPQGAHGRAGRDVPGAAADPGRLPRLLPRRPGRRRAPPGAVARPQAVRAVRIRAAREAGDAAGEAPRLRRVLGARRERGCASASTRTA